MTTTKQPEWTDEELVAMPRVNVDLLDQVLDTIIEHPDQWNQNTYGLPNDASSCGAVFCFAGHALYATDQIEMLDGYPSPKGQGGWFDSARDTLGLTDREASDLFLGTLSGGDYALNDRARMLQNVKVQVEKIRHRAKLQEEAFNRIAQEFIDAAGLDDVVRPGYECPESTEAVQRITGGERK
jgi:hypothetical protein